MSTSGPSGEALTAPLAATGPVPAETPSTALTTAAIIADLRGAIGELKCLGSERLVRMGISMTQLHVLNLLDGHGELPMSRLAELIDVSMSAATGLVDRIEERGFVERIRVPSDRRIVLARITPAGRQLLDDVEMVRTELILRALGELDETQLARFATAIHDLRSALATASQEGASHHVHIAKGRD
jgi:DNA-binding MarR family transcriptional regulator